MLAEQYRERLSHIGRQQIIVNFFNDPQVRAVSFHGGWYELEFIDGSILIIKGKEIEVKQ
jgi:catabolite regulation protein CreA